MSTMEIITILKRMDQMIGRRSTGGPENFARRLGVSERTMYNYLDVLKGLGATIHFSRCSNSYLYIEEGRLRLGYEKQNQLHC